MRTAVSRYNIALRAMTFVTTLMLLAGDTGVTSQVAHVRFGTDHDDVCPFRSHIHGQNYG